MPGTMLDVRSFRVRERGMIPKKQENPVICNNMSELGGHYAE